MNTPTKGWPKPDLGDGELSEAQMAANRQSLGHAESPPAAPEPEPAPEDPVVEPEASDEPEPEPAPEPPEQ